MVENFFDTLSAVEKRRVKERRDVLVRLLQEWAARYPLIRTVRIPSFALLIATVLPRAALPDALLMAKLTLWIQGVDDALDERALPFAELPQKVDRWRLAAHDGRRGAADDGLTAIILEIREELSRYRFFEPLHERWAADVHRMVAAMAQEYRYGLQYGVDAPVLPSLDEYLCHGRYSIGMPLWVSTALIVLGDPSIEQHLQLVDEAVNYASTAGRLYNDVRTFDKERQENNVNSVLIIYHTLLDEDADLTEETRLTQAKRSVLELADSYARQCYALTRRIRTNGGHIEQMLDRTIAFHAYFYSEHDYHTASLAETDAMLAGVTREP